MVKFQKQIPDDNHWIHRNFKFDRLFFHATGWRGKSEKTKIGLAEDWTPENKKLWKGLLGENEMQNQVLTILE